MIDAFKKRGVSTVNIPGAFLQTKMSKGDDDGHAILDDRIADFSAKTAPKTYQEYVHQRHGQSYT